MEREKPSGTVTSVTVNVGCDVPITSRGSSQQEVLRVVLQFGDYNL